MGQQSGWKKGSVRRNQMNLKVSAGGPTCCPGRKALGGGTAKGLSLAAWVTVPQELPARVIFHRVSAQLPSPAPRPLAINAVRPTASLKLFR